MWRHQPIANLENQVKPLIVRVSEYRNVAELLIRVYLTRKYI